MSLQASVIISTYNSPAWLYKVLIGFEVQDVDSFEIIIADDGSKEETKELIENFAKKSRFPIKHVWHEDNGFQKTIILNKAIEAAESPYLIFTDGDCIPRQDFMRVHYNKREKGYFLSGGYFKLSMKASENIQESDIKNQNCFNLAWLKSNGVAFNRKSLRFIAKKYHLEPFLNFITPTTPSWNGHNASGWTEDILKVNGFDERMEYGAEDREMGDRLWNLGIKSKQIRYSAICVHLDHKRGYVNQEALDKNRKIWNETKQTKKTYTPYGIQKA